MAKLYRGFEDRTVLVHEAGLAPARAATKLNPRHDLRNHSPAGFAWGYSGSGPAQLALALACDVLADDDRAMRLYHGLKFSFVGRLPIGQAWGPVSDDELRLELAEVEANDAAPP